MIYFVRQELAFEFRAIFKTFQTKLNVYVVSPLVFIYFIACHRNSFQFLEGKLTHFRHLIELKFGMKCRWQCNVLLSHCFIRQLQFMKIILMSSHYCAVPGITHSNTTHAYYSMKESIRVIKPPLSCNLLYWNYFLLFTNQSWLANFHLHESWWRCFYIWMFIVLVHVLS